MTTNRNIQGPIRRALTQVITAEMQTNVAGDALALQTIRTWPLQDDPTQVAPYVVFGAHPQLGSVPDHKVAEIGGAVKYWSYWRAVCGVPQQATRDDAYDAIEELVTRLEESLQTHYDLANVLGAGQLVSGDNREAIWGNDPDTMLMGSAVRIFGGDGEFYGESKTIWRYRFERVRVW